MWDFFFFSGTLPLKDEIEEELIQLFLQKKGVLYFNRSEGTDIHLRENSPGSIEQEIEMRFDIADAAARRNLDVDDGERTGRDKRVTLSQYTISFSRPTTNDLDIEVGYFAAIDLQNFQKIQVRV